MGGFVGVGAEEEAVTERTEAAEVIGGEREEEDLLVDKVFKDSNVGSIASNRELRPFCLLMLGGSSCRCRRCITRGRRSRDRDIDR